MSFDDYGLSALWAARSLLKPWLEAGSMETMEARKEIKLLVLEKLLNTNHTFFVFVVLLCSEKMDV